jgi:hypothetical protein
MIERFRSVYLFNRKSVGARIWDIPLKKHASIRDRRSNAACELHVQLPDRTFNFLFPPRRASVSPRSVKCAYAVQGREKSTSRFCFHTPINCPLPPIQPRPSSKVQLRHLRLGAPITIENARRLRTKNDIRF